MHELFSNPFTGVLVGLAVLAWILYRQLQKRPVVPGGGFRPVVIIGVIGLLQAAQVISDTTPIAIAGWVVGTLVGAGFAVLRGRSVRLFTEQGMLMRQGTAVTIVLWLVAIAIHVGVDFGAGVLAAQAGAAHASSFAGSTTLLYLAVVLGIQQVVVQQRARGMHPAAA